MDGYPFQQESHEMVFERMIAQNTDELYCPVCGRRIVIQWAPDFKKTVLEPGNENAIHTASKRGPGAGSEVYPTPEELTADDMQRLTEWETFIQQIDFDPPEELTENDCERLSEWETLLQRINFESWWA